MIVSIRFEPRDLWVGAYWDTQVEHETRSHYPAYGMWARITTYKVYICILPMLPIVLSWTREYPVWGPHGKNRIR